MDMNLQFNSLGSARSELRNELAAKIETRTARLAVIGLGYVGLPLILALHAKGFRVLAVDIDQAKIDALRAGQSYIKHIGGERIAELVQSQRFSATTDFSELAKANAVIVCVPTPLTKHLEPDLSYIVSTSRDLAAHVRPGQLIILESTTYPGTTRDVMLPLLQEGSGLSATRDFFLAYSPEREDPGNPSFGTTTVPRIVSGIDDDALHVAAALYGAVVPKVVPVSSPEVAEAAKLTENIFRSVNIAMVNELKLIYDAINIDVWEVIEAASSKPFGFMPFFPGPGLGGHCIPIDPYYLTWRARAAGVRTRFIELSGELNRHMPAHTIAKLSEALSKHLGKALSRARVLIVGIAYKKNVDDMRESPALALMKQFEKAGTAFDYYDPHIPVIPPTREHPELAGRRSVTWNSDVLSTYDAVLIVTDHDDIDLALAVEVVPLVVDTRNACKRAGLVSAKIVKA